MRVEPKSLVRRLDPTCTRALERAVERAVGGHFYEITVEHLLLGLVEQDASDVAAILKHFGKQASTVTNEIERALQGMRSGNTSRPVFSERMFRWIEDTWVVTSVERGATMIRSGDLLFELLAHPGQYTAEEFPTLAGIGLDDLRREFDAILAGSPEAVESAPTDGGATARPAGTAAGREALDRFTISFTARAGKGEIDPIFGRDREIRQVIDILARRRKNNPIIVGEPGVGKTALVEGLARAIVAGEVPDALRGTELLGLDLGLLQAGAGVRGEIENRLKKVIAEVKGSPTPIILFIDEAHTLMGGGQSGNEIPNLLKPALARGELRTIAATTWSEFKKYFEKDAALERRFQPVKVDEPSVEDTVLMLRGLRKTYEDAHAVTIRDEAIEAAAELSHRYISGRQLPDKAVDLLDTAAARVKIEQAALPDALVRARSRLAALERERDAVDRDVQDGSSNSNDRIAQLETKLADVARELESIDERWKAEQEALKLLLEAQDRLRETKRDDAEREGKRRAVDEARTRLAEVQQDSPLVHAEVDRDAIARVVADWTGIPVGKMKASSISQLLELEDNLQRRIRGQDEATRIVAESIRMAHAGVRDPRTPVAVLLFVGPSGVGKTETALALADLLYGGERSLTTINMSEFQEKHTVSRLIGSPPGYVGYGEGGVLTEAVRQKPYSVVLLDECEKADLEVMNLFYQVFDKGMLSDGEGRLIDFRNTVLILTSNLATDQLMQVYRDGADPAHDDVVAHIRPTLSGHFKPALLARMTVVPYRPMSPEILRQITGLKLQALADRLRQSHATETEFEDTLVEDLVARCTESETGARAVDHALRGSLMPRLAKEILVHLAEGALPQRLRIGKGAEGWTLSFAER